MYVPRPVHRVTTRAADEALDSEAEGEEGNDRDRDCGQGAAQDGADGENDAGGKQGVGDWDDAFEIEGACVEVAGDVKSSLGGIHDRRRRRRRGRSSCSVGDRRPGRPDHRLRRRLGRHVPVIDRLLVEARAASAAVVIIQHCGSTSGHLLHRDAAGWRLHPTATPHPGESVFEKTWSDAFRDTTLHQTLLGMAVTRVVVGAQTEFCDDTTTRSAVYLGYDVDLVADGHTTSDNGLLSRQEIVAHHNQTLSNLALVGVSVRVLPSAEVKF